MKIVVGGLPAGMMRILSSAKKKMSRMQRVHDTRRIKPIIEVVFRQLHGRGCQAWLRAAESVKGTRVKETAFSGEKTIPTGRHADTARGCYQSMSQVHPSQGRWEALY
jgi:hypothetical protein